MEELSVSNIVKIYEKMNVEEIGNLAPAEICAHLVVLSSRLWTIGSEIVRTDSALAHKWIELRATAKTDKETEMLIKTTNEYSESHHAKYAEKVVLSLIQSLKKVLKSKEIEYTNMV